jgi:superfamily I DNA/RNA helicase
MRYEVILGPPGTGKTTELRKLVREAVDHGVSPADIGYLAFTRNAARVARDLVMEEHTGFPRSAFHYFSTLHSLCFRLAGITTTMMMTGPQMAVDFRHVTGCTLHGPNKKRWLDKFNDGYRSNVYIQHTPDEIMLAAINLARQTFQKPEDVYASMPHADAPTWELRDLQHRIRMFKLQYGCLDFTDLLEGILDPMVFTPRFKLLCIDEAQDLSPLQWAVVDKLALRADRVVLAGDDDQAIFRWAGASVERFIEEGRANGRVLDQSYRCPRMVADLASKITAKMQNRVPKVWRPTTHSGEVITESAFDVNLYACGNTLILSRYDIPKTDMRTHMYHTYGEDLSNVRHMSIHEAKGDEADTVIFQTALTKEIDAIQHEDDELRLLYVAVTRAKNKLVISHPLNGRGYEI